MAKKAKLVDDAGVNPALAEEKTAEQPVRERRVLVEWRVDARNMPVIFNGRAYKFNQSFTAFIDDPQIQKYLRAVLIIEVRRWLV